MRSPGRQAPDEVSGEGPARAPGPPDLSALTARIRGILRTPGVGREVRPRVPTGWAGADEVLRGGLSPGALHEWFGVGAEQQARHGGCPWTPPLYLAIHLAWQAIESLAESRAAPGLSEPSGPSGPTEIGRVLWIGREIWPYPRALVRDFGVRVSESPGPVPSGEALHGAYLELVHWPGRAPDGSPGSVPVGARFLLEHSLLVDAAPAQRRLWAVDAALRCPSVAVVVADGSGFDMAATRRLQLAAATGQGLGLLLRPPWEAKSLSAATTRWRVSRSAPVDGAARPRWWLELSRSKGLSTHGPTGPGPTGMS